MARTKDGTFRFYQLFRKCRICSNHLVRRPWRILSIDGPVLKRVLIVPDETHPFFFGDTRRKNIGIEGWLTYHRNNFTSLNLHNHHRSSDRSLGSALHKLLQLSLNSNIQGQRKVVTAFGMESFEGFQLPSGNVDFNVLKPFLPV